MEEYHPYSCERCGDCCRHVDLIDELKDFDRGDGVCKYLTADNLCKIYSERPPLCKSEYLYRNFCSHMTVEEFNCLMLKLCKDVRRRGFEGFH